MKRISCLGLFVGLLCVAKGNGCTNKRPDCIALAKEGYCLTHSLEMREECPAACRFCGLSFSFDAAPSTSNENRCEDLDVNCRNWAWSGICRSDGLFMELRCPKACNFCEKHLQSVMTIARPEFDCGRPYLGKVVITRDRVVRQAPTRQQHGSQGSQQGNAEPIISHLEDITSEDAICGANIIHPRYILTSAHCIRDPAQLMSSEITVRLGELDFSQKNETNSRPADYAIEQIIVHPGFQFGQMYNDVALLQTRRPIEFNEFVYPFCLSSVRLPPHTPVTVAGFGKVNATSYATVLQEVDLNTISLSECEESYRQKNFEGALRSWYPDLLQGYDAMCAGHPGRGACEGDEGGPLFWEDQDGRRYLVGMVSVAMACKGTPISKLPGTFVSIADHIDFIDSVLYGS